MADLKVAVVGCGKFADAHIEEIGKLGRARVVALCDRELLLAEQAAMRYRVPGIYDDFDRLLERERPDVVHITTPPASHLPLGARAIEAGCHVFVEKPFTPTLAESQELVAEAERAGKKLTIGWSYLFEPTTIVMREMLATGVLGEVVHVESVFGSDLSGPFGAALLGDGDHWVHRLPGKLFHNNIDHVLSRLLELLDVDAPDVHALAFLRREKRFGDARDELHDELRLTLGGRRMTAHGVFTTTAKPTPNHLRVYGTKNTVSVDYVKSTTTLDAAPRLPSAIGRLMPAFDQAMAYLREGGRNARRFARSEFQFFSGLSELTRRFHESIVSGGPQPIPNKDILRVGAMIDEIVHQARRRVERAA